MTPAPRDNREAAKTDLSRVSLEERLAYYKRKYGDEYESRGTGESKRGGKPQGGRDQGGNGRGGRNEGGRGGQPRGSQGGSGARKGAGNAKSGPKRSERPKPSLIGRILGIFGKKK